MCGLIFGMHRAESRLKVLLIDVLMSEDILQRLEWLMQILVFFSVKTVGSGVIQLSFAELKAQNA